MKRHKDALKKERQARKRRARNQSAIAAIKTLRKKAAGATGADREAALRLVASAVGRAARKGVLHRNTAARIISRASKKAAAK